MLFVFALCLMAACKGEKSPAGVNTAEELAAFVKETYTDVFAAYAEANSQGTVPDISVFRIRSIARSSLTQIIGFRPRTSARLSSTSLIAVPPTRTAAMLT